jgi:hypothetical protein
MQQTTPKEVASSFRWRQLLITDLNMLGPTKKLRALCRTIIHAMLFINLLLLDNIPAFRVEPMDNCP